MSDLGWRVVQIGGAFLSAFVLPAVALIVVTGLVRTGAVGVLAFTAWVVAMVQLGRILLRRGR